MRPQASRTFTVLIGQLLLNLFLISWLFDEYLHNPFMQQYLSDFWGSSATLALVAAVIIGAAILGSYLAIWRKQAFGFVQSNSSSWPRVQIESASELKALDVCPFCNVPMKALSENRFQCRQCRRYFKK